MNNFENIRSGSAETGPLFIPAGTDSFEKIWPAQSPAQCTLDFCKAHSESKLGVDRKPNATVLNPALDPRFAEPDIDRLYAEMMAKLRLPEEDDE